MEALQSGYMYMFPAESELYAAVPSRVWWAPWRWSLSVYWLLPSGAENYIEYAEAEVIATNVTKAECIGLMKVLGYTQEITC
jgi:hypothetical protein